MKGKHSILLNKFKHAVLLLQMNCSKVIIITVYVKMDKSLRSLFITKFEILYLYIIIPIPCDRQMICLCSLV